MNQLHIKTIKPKIFILWQHSFPDENLVRIQLFDFEKRDKSPILNSEVGEVRRK